MKTVELKTRKWLRNLFKCISFTTVAFIFQACYGPAPDMSNDIRFVGTVTAKNTNLPIKGIKVVVNDGLNYGITHENGTYNIYVNVPGIENSNNSFSLRFLDVDGIENGSFRDTTIMINPMDYKSSETRRAKEISINMEMSEKE
jgi:hypothetical protein